MKLQARTYKFFVRLVILSKNINFVNVNMVSEASIFFVLLFGSFKMLPLNFVSARVRFLKNFVFLTLEICQR